MTTFTMWLAYDLLARDYNFRTIKALDLIDTYPEHSPKMPKLARFAVGEYHDETQLKMTDHTLEAKMGFTRFSRSYRKQVIYYDF